VTADALPRTAVLTDEELRIIAGEALDLLGGEQVWALAASNGPGELWLARHDGVGPVFLRASYDRPGHVAVLSWYLRETGYQQRRSLDATPAPDCVVSAVLRILDGAGVVR
jgi:hypothetical protein